MNRCRKAAASRDLWQAWLKESRLGEVLPEVEALRGVPQDPCYHQEGDALAHTLLAVEQVDEEDDERIFWAVLLHDIGKAVTTRFEDGRWRSRGHCQAGAALAKAVMGRLGWPELAADVAWLVRHHQFHLAWRQSSSKRLSRRQKNFCSQKLFPLLVRVAQIDAKASLGVSQKGKWLEDIVSQAIAEGILAEREVDHGTL